ncbi:MAG: M14 family metallopeptidase [Bacteroidota bacterium]
MRYLLVALTTIFSGIIVCPAQETVFEKSEGKSTGTYREVIKFYQDLAQKSEYVQILEMGQTDVGYPLHLVTLDAGKGFNFQESFEQGKTIILINNGIHPGEPDGIEASMMFLRDMADKIQESEILKNVIVAVVPIYNIGGALNRNSASRANQNGPTEYGFRGNARNYDLNRDFIKADTKNTQSFYELFHLVKPDIFIDTHVSNGADYQYVITHLATQHNKMGGEMGVFIENTFTPQLEKRMDEKGSEITPYVNVFNRRPDEGGFSQFLDNPRYSTGFTTLFSTLGFMIETHMLKPFPKRVEATYDFLESILELANDYGEKIRQIKINQSKNLKPGDLHPVSWRLSKAKYKTIKFKGYVGEMIPSKVTGQSRLLYGRNRPYEKELPYYNNFVPQKEIVVPSAYLIPQNWFEVIERLKWNKVVMRPLERDTAIAVETYRIENYKTSSSPYEGHYPHRSITTTTSIQKVAFRRGDLVIPIDQENARYIVEVLEPQATDSFFAWNFFDTILQQKEHFSPYVFEEAAWHLLNQNDSLKMEFEAKKKLNSEFANDWYAQLDFIYKHSDYYEDAHLTYPVYRLVDL